MNLKEDRRKKNPKPKIFREQRESMLLIKQASPADIYIWCISLIFITIIIVSFLLFAIFNHMQQGI